MQSKVLLSFSIMTLILISILPNAFASSALQVIVDESGDGNAVIRYTEQDFDIMYSEYQSLGDFLFKLAVVLFVSDLGFTVSEDSISIDINPVTRTMTVTMTATDFAQEIDSTTWQIDGTIAKISYPTWSQSGRSFTFSSSTKPQLPAPESFTVELPNNAVNIQFNPNNYILTYQLSTGTVVTVNFATDPSDMGTITFDSQNYIDGGTTSITTGTYVISANPASGYTFSRWETFGLIFADELSSSTTNCTVNGIGTIKMIQTSPTQTPPPPSGCIIATASYGSPMTSEVIFMRNVRDNMIGSNELGRILVTGWNIFYYSWSPPVANMISGSDTLQTIFRVMLLPLVAIIHSTAFIYSAISPLSFTLASVVAFIFAGIFSIIVYTIIPLLSLRVVSNKIILLRRLNVTNVHR